MAGEQKMNPIYEGKLTKAILKGLPERAFLMSGKSPMARRRDVLPHAAILKSRRPCSAARPACRLGGIEISC